MPGPNPRHPVVLFDVGGTLVGPRDSYGSVYHQVLGRLGLQVDVGTLDEAIGAVSRQALAPLAPGADRFASTPGGEREFWRRFVRATLAHVGCDAPDGDFVERALALLRDAFFDPLSWRIFDDALACLERLRREGFRMAVVSNWDSRLPDLLKRLELDDFFEVVTVSQAEGIEKPDPEIFRRTLSRLRAGPSSALHVGDVRELDVAGARAAGITGILIDRHPSSRECGDTIVSLESLPEIARSGL